MLQELIIGLVNNVLNQNCVVAQILWIILCFVTEAFIWVVAGIITLIGTSPVWATLVTGFTSPSRLANAEVGRIGSPRGMAESIVAIQSAVRLVTKVPFPSALTDTGVGMIHTAAMSTSCHGLADFAIISSPSIIADTFIGSYTLSIGAVVAAWDVTVCSFPPFIAVAFKSILTRAMFTAWQRNTNIAIGTFPSNFTGAVVWSSTVSVNTSQSIVVTDRFKARIQFCLSILDFRFFPSRLADDITLVVTDIPLGMFQIFRFAWMIVNVQGCEPHTSGYIGQQRENNTSFD